MAINQAMCGSYKREAIAGIHFWLSHSRTGSSSIGADTFKIALSSLRHVLVHEK